MTINELKILRNLDLETKILKTKARIREWYYYHSGEVYISFSGGKDSTVLLDLVRQEFPDVVAVFCDTGLEYPEIKEFVKTFDNIEIIKPKINFTEVINKYGYPVISKEQSQYISQYKNAKSEKTKNTRIHGDAKGRFKISEKYLYLINAPFKISDMCCNVMKKNPFKKYEKEKNKVPIIATLTEESSLRTQEFLQNGCNSFNKKRATSKPLSFWREQDILEYIKINNIKIADCYGELKQKENLFGTGELYFSKLERTGCMFCLYGIQFDKEENRIQKMKRTHPKIYDYCIKNLKIGEVLDYIGIKY